MLAQVADGSGMISFNTVLLALIGLGTGILAYVTANANRAAKDREDAREDARRERDQEREKLAEDRDKASAEALATIHAQTNNQLTTLSSELAASREETRLTRERVEALLVEKALATPVAPVAVYTPPGSALEVTADAAAPVPVVSVPPASG